MAFKMNKFRWTLVSTLLLVLVAGADYLTKVELKFSVFYFLPIALLAWKAGVEMGFAAAVTAAVAWWLVEVFTAQTHSSAVLAGANYALRVTAFVVIAVTAARLRQARDRERELNAQLESTVSKLEASMAEMNELRDQMQLVCAWTNRIKSEGRWVPMDQFLADKLHLKISHGISEEAAERLLADGFESGKDQSGDEDVPRQRHGG
jgi:K+-sensing histidine kinase KdpD